MTLSDYQFSFNGLTIGQGTSFDIIAAEGADSFDVRSNDQAYPSLWGVQPGSDFVNGRSVTLTVQSITRLGLQASVDAAFLPPSQASPTTLRTLTWKFPDRVELQCSCRVRRKARPRSVQSESSVSQWIIQLDAPDPRLYSTTLQTISMTAWISDTSGLDATTGSGADLAIDLATGSGADLAVDFTGVGSSGSVSAVNAGTVDTYPAFVFTTNSSMSSWQVVNDTTGETASFVFALTTGSGHSLTADMAAAATPSGGVPITSNGSSNYAAWQAPRVALRLVPGTNTLRFIVASGTASDAACSASFRSAYL